MVSLRRGLFKEVPSALLLAALICSNAFGQECQQPAGRGFYVGVFGGGGNSTNVNANQSGTAQFGVGGPAPNDLGPLSVSANGSTSGRGTGIVGIQVGQELSSWATGADGRSWSLRPAGELEAYYMGNTQKGTLSSPGPRLPEHDFADSFPMNSGVFLVNGVLNLQTPSARITPYVGGGVGSAFVTIANADSPQVNPPEAGVNHFNSDPNASSWAFAAQAKTGIRFHLTERCWLFTEYRFLYVGSTNFTFGPTVYPTHVPTTPWNVHLGGMCQNLGVGGIGFSF